MTSSFEFCARFSKLDRAEGAQMVTKSALLAFLLLFDGGVRQRILGIFNITQWQW